MNQTRNNDVSIIGGPGTGDPNISALIGDITIERSRENMEMDHDEADSEEEKDICPADLSHLSSAHNQSYEAAVIEIKKKQMSTSMFTILEEDEGASCADKSRLDNTFISRQSRMLAGLKLDNDESRIFDVSLMQDNSLGQIDFD